MSRLKRSLAVLLAFVIALCSSVTDASAETLTVRSPWYPKVFPEDGTGAWGRNEVTMMDGSHTGAADYLSVYTIKSTGQVAYCIEPGVDFF